MGWRNGGYASVLLVAVGAAMWGTDGILRVPLLEVASPSQIVLLEHLVLLLYSVPAVVLGWRFLRGLGAAQWVALLIIGWGGSALATLLFTTAFAVGNPTVVILLQKTQPLFAIALAAILLRERLGWAYWPCFAVAMVGAYLISFGDLGPFMALGSAEAIAAALALGAALLWGSSTVLGRLVLKDMPFNTLTGARLLLAVPLLAGIVVAQGAIGGLGSGFAAEPGRVILLALIPGLLALLLYYRGLTGTRGLLRDARGIGLPGNGGRPQLDVPRRRRERKPGPWLRAAMGRGLRPRLPEREIPGPGPVRPGGRHRVTGSEGTVDGGDDSDRRGGALKVAVIGAGIVGSSVAYRLSEGGAEVVMIDGAEPGSGTTSTSFAWVNANNKLPRELFRVERGRDARARAAP